MMRALALSLLLLVGFACSAVAGPELLSPAPGSYRHDLVLSLKPPSSGQSLSYRIEVEGAPPSDRPFIPYVQPLYLSALPGQTRSYLLTLQLSEGGEVVKTDQSVYTIDQRSQPAETPAPREPAGSPSPGAAESSSGGEPPSSIRVLSPVAGTFGNRQLLYILTSGFAWVRYTLDGGDPARSGTPYDEPLILPATGKVDLRVAALPKGGSTPLAARVEFAVDEAGTPPSLPASGELSKPLVLDPPRNGKFFYTFGGSPPGSQDLPFDRPLLLSTPQGSVAYTAVELRARMPDGSWGPDYRYFYAMDRRTAPDPIIELVGGRELGKRAELRILAAGYTDVYYTTDGTQPDSTKERYRGPFTPALPAASEGTLTVSARAYAPNGSESDVVTARFPYSTSVPAPPQVTLAPAGPDGGPAVIVKVEAAPGATIVYERTLDGTTPDNPTFSSPVAPAEMTLSLPRGADAVFSLKFAAIDPAGNISPPSTVIRRRVDAYPPPPPTIAFAGGRLTLSGNGEIHYSLTDSGALPPYPGPGAPLYTAPIALAGKPDERVEYYVAAVATAEGGESSEISRGGPYLVDLRSPPPPSFWGVATGGIYDHDRTVSVASQEGIEVHYTLSPIAAPPSDPGLSSPLFPRTMQFTAAAGTEKSFVLKLRSAIGDRLGPVVTVPFTIDRVPPAIPAVKGLSKNVIVGHPLSINPPSVPLGERLFISVSTTGRPADPLGPAGRPFDTPILFSAPSGGQRLYHVRIAARDAAGNSTEDPTDYLVTIDRGSPEAPTITGAPAGSSVDGDVILTFTGTAAAYRYELASGAGDPPMPTASSPRYSGPIVLKPQGAAGTLYTLYGVGENAAGTLSRSPAVYRVLLFPKAAQSGSAGPPGSVSAEAVASEGTPPAALVAGVMDGGLYDSARTLVPAAAGAVIRYTLDPNGADPPAIGRFSPLFTKPLTLDPPPGETRRYAVRVARFASGDSDNPIAEELIRFTIDRTPPAAPSIAGVSNGGRYEQPRTFTLKAQGGGAVFYSVERLSFVTTSVSTEPAAFAPYVGAVTIGKDEPWAVYRIRAYAVDRAGNRSLQTPEWTVYFDSGVVYASPDGSNSNDGSSHHPVKSLDHALEIVLREHRNAVFLAAGRYDAGAAFRISTDMGIVGSFDSATWRRTEASEKAGTIVTVPSDASTTGPLFAVSAGATLSIDRVELRNDRSVGPLVLLSGGNLAFSSGSASSRASGEAVIESTEGSVSLDHATLDNLGGGATVTLRHTEADIRASSFASAETGGDSVLLSLAEGSNATITNSLFRPSAGLRTFSIQASNSVLRISGSELREGTATRQSTGLFAVDSKVAVSGSHFIASPLSHLSFGIQAEGGSLEVTGSTLQMAATTGSTGIWTDGTQLSLERSQVRGAPTSEFLYLVMLTASPARISGNILRGAATGDFVAISLDRSAARIVGNTLYGGTGTVRSVGVDLESSPEVDIVDNILARGSPAAGEAVSTDSSALPRLIANDITGFRILLKRPFGPSIESIEALNAADGEAKGGAIAGNLSEPIEKTFADLTGLELRAESACIGSGVDPVPFGGITTDYSGATRSAPFDIGALRHR